MRVRGASKKLAARSADARDSIRGPSRSARDGECFAVPSSIRCDRTILPDMSDRAIPLNVPSAPRGMLAVGTTYGTVAAIDSGTLRRETDRTGARLGRALLGYLVVMMAIITLAPFRFATSPVHGLTPLWTASDLAMNVVMFVPIGFLVQLTRPSGSLARWWHVLLVGAAMSIGIETAQLFEVERYSSLFDVVTNALGAAIGAVLYAVAINRMQGPTAARVLALELPLMGLVYLLVPLMWLAGLAADSASRAWLVLPIAAFAGGVLGTVHAAYLAPVRGVGRPWLVVSALLWFAVAMLPGRIRETSILCVGALLTVSTAWIRSVATGRLRARGQNRRFEQTTLRLVLPLFAAYLALSSLWPLTGAGGVFHASAALFGAGEVLSTTRVFQTLEHVAAFTLVGYIVAEFHGRELLHFRDIAARVVAWGGGISVLLELTRGWHPSYGASGLMFLFTCTASACGGLLYQLQRDHVRALLVRG